MNTSKIFIAALFATMSTFASKASSEAPFGLEWGASVAEIESQNVQLVLLHEDFGLNEYFASSLPKDLSHVFGYKLTICKEYGLQQVGSMTKIPDDASGETGQDLYFRYKNTLAEKYGAPEHELENLDTTAAADVLFYQCIEDPSCGAFVTMWEATPHRPSIMLRLKSTSHTTGGLTIQYEGPDFQKAYEAKLRRQQEDDKEVL